MSKETNAVLTYSNDGPSVSGVGLYVAQSLKINVVKRFLPTIAIFTENGKAPDDVLGWRNFVRTFTIHLVIKK